MPGVDAHSALLPRTAASSSSDLAQRPESADQSSVDHGGMLLPGGARSTGNQARDDQIINRSPASSASASRADGPQPHSQELLAGQGGTSSSTCDAATVQSALERLSFKLHGATPDMLSQDMRERLTTWINAADSNLLQVSPCSAYFK